MHEDTQDEIHQQEALSPVFARKYSRLHSIKSSALIMQMLLFASFDSNSLSPLTMSHNPPPYISSLSIHNFKSFSSKTQTLRFVSGSNVIT